MGHSASVQKDIQVCYWKVPEQIKEGYPEKDLLRDKCDVGLALSGGGMRAATLCIGWLQALEELGVLSKLKYVSTVSGSSWTFAPLTFGNHKTVNEFLGSSIKPEDCDKKTLIEFATQRSSHARVITDATFIKEMLGNFVESLNIVRAVDADPTVDFWSETVGESFFKPHGVRCALNSSLPALPGSAAIKAAENLGLTHTKVYPTQPLEKLPFYILNGSILVGGDRGAIPVEFTPLYFGAPVSYERKKVKVKAVLVEPYGFTATEKEGLSEEEHEGKGEKKRQKVLNFLNAFEPHISLFPCCRFLRNNSVSAQSHIDNPRSSRNILRQLGANNGRLYD